MTSIDLLYDGYASLNGTPDHLVPKLDPNDLCGAPHGLSGTEIHLFGTARELVRRGHDVRVYASWTSPSLSTPDGWSAFQISGGPVHPPDVAIAYHDARPLARWRGCFKAAHHQSYGLSPQEDATRFAEAYFSATEACARYHRARRGWDVRVVPNGWDYGEHQPWRPVPGRLIWNTGFERGFHRLMEALPAIVQRVPEAHVVAFTRGGPDALQRANEFENRMNDSLGAASNGFGGGRRVAIRATHSRNEVLKTVATAACFAYPCDPPSPTEVWPMSVTDCMATGVPVVLSPDDDLEELFKCGVALLPGVKASPEHWLEDLVENSAVVLKEPIIAETLGYAGMRWARDQTFARSVDELLIHLRDLGAL